MEESLEPGHQVEIYLTYIAIAQLINHRLIYYSLKFNVTLITTFNKQGQQPCYSTGNCVQLNDEGTVHRRLRGLRRTDERRRYNRIRRHIVYENSIDDLRQNTIVNALSITVSETMNTITGWLNLTLNIS
ncbi:hypothetical protein DICVIV_05254 [Dictyocaulus viviparus]|uniref:Uncharacterized protein n=1 Tax=Dictyocaulus viviparus TaxID=29172 RepID=A0A0D8Y202_DICVI|nr:hypothetical protein DICVIV_05254 [Dictyocaulus viviparus]